MDVSYSFFEILQKRFSQEHLWTLVLSRYLSTRKKSTCLYPRNLANPHEHRLNCKIQKQSPGSVLQCVLDNFAKITGHKCLRLQHRGFPVNFVKFFLNKKPSGKLLCGRVISTEAATGSYYYYIIIIIIIIIINIIIILSLFQVGTTK